MLVKATAVFHLIDEEAKKYQISCQAGKWVFSFLSRVASN